jgi:hypothetical protein
MTDTPAARLAAEWRARASVYRVIGEKLGDPAPAAALLLEGCADELASLVPPAAPDAARLAAQIVARLMEEADPLWDDAEAERATGIVLAALVPPAAPGGEPTNPDGLTVADAVDGWALLDEIAEHLGVTGGGKEWDHEDLIASAKLAGQALDRVETEVIQAAVAGSTASPPRCSTCGTFDPGANVYCSNGFHAPCAASPAPAPPKDDEDRQKGDDDGLEYGDPRDARDERRRE